MTNDNWLLSLGIYATGASSPLLGLMTAVKVAPSLMLAAKLCKEQQMSFGDSTKCFYFKGGKYFLRK